MDKNLQNFDKAIFQALTEAGQKAGEMLHRDFVRQAMEIEAPELAAQGAEQYWPRLTAYNFGSGHTLYKLDSKVQSEGQPIVYIPALKGNMVGDELKITTESAAKTGIEGEQVFLEKQGQFNVEG